MKGVALDGAVGVTLEDPPILLLLVVDKENVPIQGNFMHRGH